MKTKAELERDLAHILPRNGRPRAELVRAAHSAAAAVFVGKPTITPKMIERAKRDAFNMILRQDRLAGTSNHSYATHSHHVAEIAHVGVEEARAAWAQLRKR